MKTVIFRSGQKNPVFRFEEGLFGVSVCEDIWYPTGPPHFQAGIGGAQLLINISSSPYYLGKGRDRERMLATRAADDLSYLAYCNLVGGQDELIFDGQARSLTRRGN